MQLSLTDAATAAATTISAIDTPLEDVPYTAPIEDILHAAPIKDVPHAAPIEDVPHVAPIEDVPHVAPIEDVPAPTSEYIQDIVLPAVIPEEKTGVSAPLDHDINMELESLCLSIDNFIIKKKKIMIDKKTILEEKLMKKWHQDVNIHCRVSFTQISWKNFNIQEFTQHFNYLFKSCFFWKISKTLAIL